MSSSTTQAPLVVHTDWSRAWGGQEIRVLTELREMRRIGFRVALVVPADAELAARAEQEGIAVYPVPFTSKFDLHSWKELFRLFKAIRPDVVNTHSSEDTWMAGCAARLCKVPLVIRTRHVLAPISSSMSYNLFPRIVLTCSAAIGEQLVQQGVRREKIVVQPTGIDERRFRFSMKFRRQIREAYGIGEHEVLVGNVGFLRHYKGHPFIVRTIPFLPEHFRFMIVGEGGDLPALERLARELGVERRLIFTGHQEAPEQFFAAFDVLFFSSYEAEGVSQALVQGLLNGLPVVACDIPSNAEPLESIRTKRLIAYGDVASAGSALLELAGRRSLDAEQIEQERSDIVARYGLRTMLDNLTGLYARFGIAVS